MSATVSLYFDECDRDVQALCQAYMMRQLYWLTAGNRDVCDVFLFLGEVSGCLFHTDAGSYATTPFYSGERSEKSWHVQL